MPQVDGSVLQKVEKNLIKRVNKQLSIMLFLYSQETI